MEEYFSVSFMLVIFCSWKWCIIYGMHKSWFSKVCEELLLLKRCGSTLFLDITPTGDAEFTSAATHFDLYQEYI